jgi:hypothetical protein
MQQRQIAVYLCITYGLALAIGLTLPRAGIAPLITIPVPVIAVALTVAFTVPRGQRRAIWAAVGFNPRRGRGLLIAVLGPMVIVALSLASRPPSGWSGFLAWLRASASLLSTSP